MFSKKILHVTKYVHTRLNSRRSYNIIIVYGKLNVECVTEKKKINNSI